MDGISRFLPKYPNIEQYNNNLFNPYDGDFYNTIYNKKEFYDLQLSEVEDFPSDPGVLMKHQKIVARYLSSLTPYDGLLLFHEMGTGKTCSTIGAIEQIKDEGGFRGAVYISNKVLADNFLNELINTCTDGRYLMEDTDEELTDRQEQSRYKNSVGEFYKFGKDYTYQVFAKRISEISDDEIKRRFNNHIIVVDEVHNLTDIIKKEVSGPRTYQQFWRVLHVAEGCKIMLLSGTPMRNSVSDIATIMNLILPENKQTVTGKDFVKQYFNAKSKDLSIVTEKGVGYLSDIFKGRVSYLKAMTSDVRRRFFGEPLKIDGKRGEENFIVSESVMSEFQTRAYTGAWNRDGATNVDTNAKDQSGVYLNSRQASLFVFPDGSYGREGFDRYVEKSKKGLQRKERYSWNEEGKVIDKKLRSRGLDALSEYSSKYTDSAKIILDSIENKKLVFVYNEFLKGSGIIIFSLILKSLGFTQVMKSTDKSNKKSFAVLSGDTPNISDLIKTFNSEENIDGSYINVIIGSKAVAEGVSLKNVQVEIIQTPWFNYARIDQALARGYRFGSHRALQARGVVVVQDIYQQVAIPLGETNRSVDVEMYETAQKKDISFKKIENIMRETAFDCRLNYKRNRKSRGVENSRDCNYGACEYKCAGESDESDILDVSTYQLYYANEKIQNLKDRIINLFRTHFILPLDFMKQQLALENNAFELLSALELIINKNIPIKNRYGFTSYLQEDNDMYFLIDNLSGTGSVSVSYYTKYPNIRPDKTFTIIKDEYYNTVALPRIIENICTGKQDIKSDVERLPVEYGEMLIESAYIAKLSDKKQFTDQQLEVQSKIIDYFRTDIVEMDDKVISSFIRDYAGKNLRCLNKSSLVWEDCSRSDEEEFNAVKVKARKKLEVASFYGQLNEKDREFCIRDVRGGLDMGGHKITAGARCNSYQHKTLSYISAFFTEMEVPVNNRTLGLVKTGECGPSGNANIADSALFRKLEQGWPSVDLKAENKARDTENTLSKIPDKDDIEGLRNFLLYSMRRKMNNIKQCRPYDNYWFDPNKSEIYDELLKMGGGDKNMKPSEQWAKIEEGIMKLTLPQMQRLLYYGAMKKAPLCILLCYWFKSQELLELDPFCGKESKPKPKDAK